ncbi:MAG: hypothetical protein AAF871_15810 [Pseudomonadota bacterium]
MTRVIWTLFLCGALSTCGGIGSSNFFNRSEEPEGLVPANAFAVVDTRPLVAEVTALTLETVPGGAILRARGLAPVPGWWSAGLSPEPERSANGVLAYTFRARPPEAPARGTGRARELNVARYLTDGDLAGIRQIQVIGQNQSRAIRR